MAASNMTLFDVWDPDLGDSMFQLDQNLSMFPYTAAPTPWGKQSTVGVYEMPPGIPMGERLYNEFTKPHKLSKLLIGMTAIIANILNMCAILKTRNNLSSHYRMIISLSLSDILTGSSLVMMLMNNVLNYSSVTGLQISRCAFMIIKALNSTGLNVTLLNLMGMALDHYMAILKPLHYPSLMNKRRANIAIIVFWLVALVCGFSDFLSGYNSYHKYSHKYNYCEFIWRSSYNEEYIIFAVALLCCLVMTVAYVRIFITIRRRHTMLSIHSNDMRKNQKALYTTLLILGTFMLCWLPTVIFQLTMIIQVNYNRKAIIQNQAILAEVDRYLFTILLINTLLDPIIYAIRMREVRFGYRKMCGCCCCCEQKPSPRGRRYSVEFNSSTHCTSVLLDERKINSRNSFGSRYSMGSFKFLDRVLSNKNGVNHTAVQSESAI